MSHLYLGAPPARPLLTLPAPCTWQTVKEGTREDAEWESYAVNKSHGLRRTNQDKKIAVERALKHPRALSLSNTAIAEHVGVSRQTLLTYKQHLVKILQDTGERTVIRNGQTFTMQTAKIGKKKVQAKVEKVEVPQSDEPEPAVESEQVASESQAIEESLVECALRHIVTVNYRHRQADGVS